MRARRFIYMIAAAGISAVGFAPTATAVTLRGAGSTLAAPIVSEWAGAFQTATGNFIQYSSAGSLQGLIEVTDGLVDFGASDAPLTTAQTQGCTAAAPNTCLTIPWALSATGVGYNVPGIGSGLKLNGSVLAEIYRGAITRWNNSAIKKLNAKLQLPDLTITPVTQSALDDTYAFTSFLTSTSATWASEYGIAGDFPVGIRESGNAAVAAKVKSTSGAIGYVSGSYLLTAGITTAQIENAAGHFEYPNPNAIENAAAIVHRVPASGVSIVNPPKSQTIAYPISAFSYAIVPRNPIQNASTLKAWLTFCVTTGQSFGFTIDFVRIPKVVQDAAEAEIAKIS
ncbi:MAG: phosphate ABC transporter substrate-binding protein PstS [Solirubrobacteraceae bacterium]